MSYEKMVADAPKGVSLFPLGVCYEALKDNEFIRWQKDGMLKNIFARLRHIKGWKKDQDNSYDAWLVNMNDREFEEYREAKLTHMMRMNKPQFFCSQYAPQSRDIIWAHGSWEQYREMEHGPSNRFTSSYEVMLRPADNEHAVNKAVYEFTFELAKKRCPQDIGLARHKSGVLRPFRFVDTGQSRFYYIYKGPAQKDKKATIISNFKENWTVVLTPQEVWEETKKYDS